MYEKLTGEIYVNDISDLVRELNKSKNKFRSFKFDRRGDYFIFEILHEDSKNEKKLLKVIEKHVKKSKGKVKREKDGLVEEVSS